MLSYLSDCRTLYAKFDIRNGICHICHPFSDSMAIVTFVVFLFFLFILSIFSYILFRRWRRGVYFKRLDRAVERMKPLVEKCLENQIDRLPSEWKYPPYTIEWEAMEKVLLQSKILATEERQKSIEKLFQELGYAEFYQSLLRKGNRWRRAIAADRLGVMGATQSSIAALIKALKDPSKEVRSVALRSLSSIADERSLPLLVKELPQMVHPEEGVFVSTIKNAVIRMGESLLPILLPQMETYETRTLRLVVDSLGEIGSKKATPSLSPLLSHSDPEVRAKTAKALGKINDPSVLPDLLKMDQEPVWYVRLQVCRSLGLLRDSRGIDFLTNRLMDENWQVRAAAAEALFTIGTPALFAIAQRLKEHQDRYSREQIAEELHRSGMVEEFVNSLEHLDDPLSELKRSLLMALASLGMKSFLSWAEQNHPSVQVRLEVSNLLKSAGSSDRRSLRRTE